MRSFHSPFALLPQGAGLIFKQLKAVMKMINRAFEKQHIANGLKLNRPVFHINIYYMPRDIACFVVSVHLENVYFFHPSLSFRRWAGLINLTIRRYPYVWFFCEWQKHGAIKAGNWIIC